MSSLDSESGNSGPDIHLMWVGFASDRDSSWEFLLVFHSHDATSTACMRMRITSSTSCSQKIQIWFIPSHGFTFPRVMGPEASSCQANVVSSSAQRIARGPSLCSLQNHCGAVLDGSKNMTRSFYVLPLQPRILMRDRTEKQE